MKAPPLLEGLVVVFLVSLNKSISSCLVHLFKPNQEPQPLPPNIASLLTELDDVFSPQEGLLPHHAIEDSIDLISRTALPNATSYHLDPHEVSKIERQLKQLLNSGHVQPNCSPCTSPTFIIPKMESDEWRLMSE